MKLITSDAYTHRTYYMGLVDEKNRVNFYDGLVRVVDAGGKEYAKFPAAQYRDFVAEHVEPWSYVKFCYLKPLGWNGFEEGPRRRRLFGGAPGAAERGGRHGHAAGAEGLRGIFQHAGRQAGASHVGQPLGARRRDDLRRRTHRRVDQRPGDHQREPARHSHRQARLSGSAWSRRRAARSTIIIETDDQGLITKANLIVATQNNAARIAMSVEKAAKGLIKKGNVSEGLLNMVEMAFRAYDPCFGCATHSLPGHLPLSVSIYNRERKLLRHILQPA